MGKNFFKKGLEAEKKKTSVEFHVGLMSTCNNVTRYLENTVWWLKKSRNQKFSLAIQKSNQIIMVLNS